jgi:hypothetical protein
LELFVEVALVDATGKGRLAMMMSYSSASAKLLLKGVLIIYVGALNAVHHEVHEGKAR